jgi:UDP-2-acetamido-2-deoxy-ribo-hexuluronate aminotransferase
MKFIDLDAQYQKIKMNVNSRIQNVLDRGHYILGTEVAELERRLAEYVNVRHCVAVSSGTDALLVALLALNVGLNDEVITTPFSFIATAESIALVGAKPVFVDIDSKTYNIDVNQIEAAITDKTKAIMPVNLYGQCVDFDELNMIAARHHLPIIEDAAQSFGATYKSRRSCGLGTIGCTSFYPAKPLGCYGDGGACFTNDDEMAEKMRWILNHGQKSGYHHVTLGINGRLDTIQAAILLSKLDIFDEELQRRQLVASRYTKALTGNVATPYIKPFNYSAWAQYTIAIENRSLFRQHLSDHHIPTAVHYPVPLYQQPVFKYLNNKTGHCANADRSAEEVVSLPFHPYMREQDIVSVAEAILKFK